MRPLLFERQGVAWSEKIILQGDDTAEGHLFGSSVSISGDSIVVGAPEMANRGKVYIFTTNGVNWSQQDSFQADNIESNDQFGVSVGISGGTVVVGALGEDSDLDGIDLSNAEDIGAAYVFTRNGNSWSQQAFLKAHNAGVQDQFGDAVAISGNTVVVGASQEDSSTTEIDGPDDDATASAGAAYVFVRKGTTWSQESFLKGTIGGSASFGRSVAVDGETAIVGANGENSAAGSAYLFNVPSPLSAVAPTLLLSGKSKIKTSRSRYTLKGTAADPDGDLILVEAQDSRSKGAKKFRSAKGTTSWKYKASLKVGRNRINLRAVDAQGNISAIKGATIIRK